MDEIVIELPEDAAPAFEAAWEERRREVDAPDDHKLPPVETTSEGFDAATLLEWAIPILAHTGAILSGVAAILVARRGKVFVDDEAISLEGYTAEEAERLLEKIARNKRD